MSRGVSSDRRARDRNLHPLFDLSADPLEEEVVVQAGAGSPLVAGAQAAADPDRADVGVALVVASRAAALAGSPLVAAAQAAADPGHADAGAAVVAEAVLVVG